MSKMFIIIFSYLLKGIIVAHLDFCIFVYYFGCEGNCIWVQFSQDKQHDTLSRMWEVSIEIKYRL